MSLVKNKSLLRRTFLIFGAFVTLHKNGVLRGCIGYIEPIAPLFKSIMDNAESAALRDRRFKAVTSSELEEIEIEISVLTKPVAIDSYQKIELGTHGIILKKSWHRAVYLPQVATEQGWNRDEMLGHLCRKAGLSETAWKDGASFYTFQAQVFSESRLQP